MSTDTDLDIHPPTNAPLLSRLLALLKCTSCGKTHFEIHRDESTELAIQTHCVVVCNACQTCIKYENGILEMITEKPVGLTVAQKSNFMSPVARNYLSGWRSWCMTVFCAQKFSNAMESKILLEMIAPTELADEPVFVDLGTSHGFYAIEIAGKLREIHSDGFVIAVDFSKKMLRCAVAAAERSGVGEKILWLLADVENLPLAAACADRVTCGGSLNEYRHAEKAIQESARILKNNGRYFTMNLFSKGVFTRFLLSVIHLVTGLSFFNKEYWNSLFIRNGFQILQQEIRGIVMFTLSKK